MWTWALLLFFLRPLCLAGDGYLPGHLEIFQFQRCHGVHCRSAARDRADAAGAMGSATVFGIKAPLIVIVVDYTCFLLLGLGVRALRRMLYQTSLSHGSLKRTLLIGTELGLVSGLRQIDMFPELTVMGLLAPDADWSEDRISGFRVIGTPGDLAKHLASGQVDLVLVADSDLAASATPCQPPWSSGSRFGFCHPRKRSSAGTCAFLPNLRRRVALGNGSIWYLSPILW